MTRQLKTILRLDFSGPATEVEAFVEYEKDLGTIEVSSVKAQRFDGGPIVEISPILDRAALDAIERMVKEEAAYSEPIHA